MAGPAGLNSDTGTGQEGHDHRSGCIGPPGPDVGVNVTATLISKAGLCETSLESTLTSVHPYALLALSERLSVYGILSCGKGELTLEVDANGRWAPGTLMKIAEAEERRVQVPGALTS